MFYLGNDILYGISKDRIFTIFEFIKANKKPHVIPLHLAEIFNIKDPKDNKPLIKLSINNAPALILKPNNQQDFISWFNFIQMSAMNATGKKKLEDFGKALGKLEIDMSEIDKNEITTLFSGIEHILKSETSRTLMFEQFSNANRKFSYLGVLYDTLQNFQMMSKFGRLSNSLDCARKIYKIVTNFDLQEMGNEEDKCALVYNEEDLNRPEEPLQIEVKEMMKTIVNPEILQSIKTDIEFIEKEGFPALKQKSELIFSELTKKLYIKIEETQKETFKTNSKNQELKLLSIPVTKLKKSLQWSMPNLFINLCARSVNFLEKKAASMYIKGGTPNPKSMLMPPKINWSKSNYLGNDKVGTTRDESDTGILDM